MIHRSTRLADLTWGDLESLIRDIVAELVASRPIAISSVELVECVAKPLREYIPTPDITIPTDRS